ncbi:unnamed protein product [Penicillium salamii]|nr:unnamed protein product [Penicillium salamii]
MDTAASLIAVIQLTGCVASICGGYIKEVKDAKDEISDLQRTAISLEGALLNLKEFLDHSSTQHSPAFQILRSDVARCSAVLTTLKEKIDPGKKAMKRLGLRSLKWPLKRQEMARTIQDLERYKSSFTLHLQVDQAQVAIYSLYHVDQGIYLERLPEAPLAEFDSYMNQHQDECLPGTRTELLLQINEWAVSAGKMIFWLNGMAGTGKSTIARSMARSFKQANILGASFFFRRGQGDLGNATRFISSITRQLLTHVPQLLPGVRKAIYNDPNIATKSMKEQFEKLLLQPLQGLEKLHTKLQLLVLVIDALDECEGDDDTRTILQLLPQLQIGNLNLRVLLTSRPELPICFGLIKFADHDQYALHEIPAPMIEHDLSLYLNHRLSNIREERSLPLDWPGSTKIHQLVGLSVPLFIFASTICRLLEDSQWHPEDSLADILAEERKGSGLDGTYLPVLNRIVKNQSNHQRKQLISEFKEVVGAIILLETPLSVISLSKLARLSKRLIHLRLDSLHSVLNIPKDESSPVKLFHLSFRDFLVSQEIRENHPEFWINKEEVHGRIAARCITLCHESLRKDICGLRASGTAREEIKPQTIEDCFPSELQYSCRYWVHHAVRSNDLRLLTSEAFRFLKNHFLHWLEAMSILGLLSEAAGMVDLLLSAIQVGLH